MKKSQKGSVSVILIILVVLLAAAVVYLTVIKKPTAVQQTSPVTDTSIPATTTDGSATSTPSVSKISVSGMKQYTDASFGFSFWYPSTWEVTVPKNPPFGAQLTGVAVVKTLGLQPIGQTYPSVMIEEAHSTQRTITDTGGAGPFGPITYFFDPTTHLWMTTNSEDGKPTPAKAADISNNTMGGLHMFGGTSRFDTKIVPLSADNFVVVGDGGEVNATSLTATIVAADTSVAVPVSAAEQTKIIQQEQTAFSPSSQQ